MASTRHLLAVVCVAAVFLEAPEGEAWLYCATNLSGYITLGEVEEIVKKKMKVCRMECDS